MLLLAKINRAFSNDYIELDIAGCSFLAHKNVLKEEVKKADAVIASALKKQKEEMESQWTFSIDTTKHQL